MISLYQHKDGNHIALNTKLLSTAGSRYEINMWEVESGLELENKEYNKEELYNYSEQKVHDMVKSIVIEQGGKIIKEKVYGNTL